MPKERERPVEQVLHRRHKLLDKLLHIGNRCFGDTAETAGRFDRHHLDRRIDELRPGSIHGGASAGERKAKQASFGSRSCAHNHQPTAGVSFGAADDRSAFFAEGGFRRDRPIAHAIFVLDHDLFG